MSWNCMRGLKLILRAARLRGVPGKLFESLLVKFAKDRKYSSPSMLTESVFLCPERGMCSSMGVVGALEWGLSLK